MGSYYSGQTPGNGGSCSSTDTDASYKTKSTAPTIISDRATGKRTEWPSFDDEVEIQVIEPKHHDEDEELDPRASVSTYASTTRSEAELQEEEEEAKEEQVSPYEVDDRQENFPTDALASTPSSFARLFPSSRRLLIRHDDATIDGNMNLRVDTVVPCRAGYQQDVILFHLRMYDLFSRKFSFRRYCRDSGREVCHSARKEIESHHGDRRRRSLSSVLASLRPSSSAGEKHGHFPHDLKRHDSGYEADTRDGLDPFDLDNREQSFDNGVGSGSGSVHTRTGPALAETILLEFSNYAHVELQRRGGPGAAKRYEYEYWSTKYQWRREFRKEGDLREVSYYLVDTRTSKTIAHMVPEIMTPLEAVEEDSKGGWVPPCSLWISDSSVYDPMPDVAE